MRNRPATLVSAATTTGPGGKEAKFYLYALVGIAMVWMRRYSYLSSILTGIILATLPVVMRFSQEIRGYALLLSATALAFYFASRLKAEPQKLTGYVGLTASLAVAVLTHMVGVMLIIPVWLFIVTMNSDIKRIELGKAFLTIAIPAALFIFFKYFFLYRSPSHDWWMPQVNLEMLWSIFRYVQDSSAWTWPVSLIKGKNPAPGVYLSYLAMLLCLILALIFLAWGQWRRTAALSFGGHYLLGGVAGILRGGPAHYLDQHFVAGTGTPGGICGAARRHPQTPGPENRLYGDHCLTEFGPYHHLGHPQGLGIPGAMGRRGENPGRPVAPPRPDYSIPGVCPGNGAVLFSGHGPRIDH